MLRAVLDIAGYFVTLAANAEDAKQKLACADFDVVITDMRMESDFSGYEVVRAARRKSFPSIIVIITAFHIGEEEWREAGAHASFMKPVPVNEFLRTIDQLLLSSDRLPRP